MRMRILSSLPAPFESDEELEQRATRTADAGAWKTVGGRMVSDALKLGRMAATTVVVIIALGLTVTALVLYAFKPKVLSSLLASSSNAVHAATNDISALGDLNAHYQGIAYNTATKPSGLAKVGDNAYEGMFAGSKVVFARASTPRGFTIAYKGKTVTADLTTHPSEMTHHHLELLMQRYFAAEIAPPAPPAPMCGGPLPKRHELERIGSHTSKKYRLRVWSTDHRSYQDFVIPNLTAPLSEADLDSYRKMVDDKQASSSAAQYDQIRTSGAAAGSLHYDDCDGLLRQDESPTALMLSAFVKDTHDDKECDRRKGRQDVPQPYFSKYQNGAPRAAPDAKAFAAPAAPAASASGGKVADFARISQLRRQMQLALSS